jgi:hypothetical protein
LGTPIGELFGVWNQLISNSCRYSFEFVKGRKNGNLKPIGGEPGAYEVLLTGSPLKILSLNTNAMSKFY